MSPEAAIDIGRDAILLMLLASAPILITGLVVGLITGIFQAVTQINETVSVIYPKTGRCRAGCEPAPSVACT